ncbi:hypothetical protein [Megasphaera cerevisiae]|nr:hypothetical protein [Megasphaera cerevisiae]SJZ61063.1 hypothetical protein SAMN05660900_00959 [Megasphaera cerevisiae DSM 20462]
MIQNTYLKDLLSSIMYTDTVTVTRQMPTIDEEGADGYKPVDVYVNIPCKLSQYGKELESNQEDRAFKLRTDLRLCMDPKYKVLPNDIMTVCHEDQTFVLYAAQPFCYEDHQEISVRRREEA